MHVLVTGGGGYIGLELCRLLLERGDNVRVVDRFFFGEGPLRTLADASGGRLSFRVGDVREISTASTVCRTWPGSQTIRRPSTTPKRIGR